MKYDDEKTRWKNEPHECDIGSADVNEAIQMCASVEANNYNNANPNRHVVHKWINENENERNADWRSKYCV